MSEQKNDRQAQQSEQDLGQQTKVRREKLADYLMCKHGSNS